MDLARFAKSSNLGGRWTRSCDKLRTTPWNGCKKQTPGPGVSMAPCYQRVLALLAYRGQRLDLQSLCVAGQDTQGLIDVGALRIIYDEVDFIARMPSPLAN